MSNIIVPKGRRSIPDELIQFGRHLVYSEGTKTEPLYIESIKKDIASKYKCPVNDIEIINANQGKSYNTTGLINFALNDVKRRLDNEEKIDHVWFIFDKDDFPENKYKEACYAADKLNDSNKENSEGFKYNKDTHITYHSCWSNESFELWLYLYFEYLDAKLTRKDYIDKIEKIPNLKKSGFKYSKSLTDIHQRLSSSGGSIDKAISSAKKLVSKFNTDNPSTKFYEFAEYFKAYMN